MIFIYIQTSQGTPRQYSIGSIGRLQLRTRYQKQHVKEMLETVLRMLLTFQEYQSLNKFSADEVDATCLSKYHPTTLSLGEKITCGGDFGEPQRRSRPHYEKDKRDPWFLGKI